MKLDFGRKFAVAIAVLAMLTVGPAAAQTLPDQNRPSGSPLSSDSSSNSNDRRAISPPVIDPTGGSPMLSPTLVVDTERNQLDVNRLLNARTGVLDASQAKLKIAKPNEFEAYVARVLGRTLPRFGSDLILPSDRDFAVPATSTIPPDYVLNVGDVVGISMTGSIEGSVEREIDTDGKIFLPRVGSISLAGVRYADLHDRISTAIGRQFRGYNVNVRIRQLRGIRVYVTGFANNPGAFTVNSLSTMASAVFAAGGPSSGGSFRSVKLYRSGAEVGDFDLYQLVRGGNRVNDAVLQNEDVLFIPPVGPQVALVGSVNEEAIYEAKPGESLETLLSYAGGPNNLADQGRMILYRTADPNLIGPQQIGRQQAAQTAALGGDIVQILSQGSLIQPVDRQSVLVRIEGEVNRPGNYYVRPNTPLTEVLAQAGGTTAHSYLFGTKLQRVSVRAQQREAFQEAVKQLELTLAAAPLTADTSQNAGDRAAQLGGARAVLDRLRTAEPDGRVVMDIPVTATSLPANVLLENNDQIYVPQRPSTVGVFGAVYRPASFLINEARPVRIRDYIERAGGQLRAADRKGIIVVRANGEVVSERRGALRAYALPGDVIFVPVKTQSNSFWNKLRDITSTLFQLGLSAAVVKTL